MGEELAILGVGLLLVGVAFCMYLRDTAAEERPLETRVRDPRTRTVVYAIPAGADPAAFRLAVDRAGFIGEIDRVRDARRLRVACKCTERAALRGVLEAAHASTTAGAPVQQGHVKFEDEL